MISVPFLAGNMGDDLWGLWIRWSYGALDIGGPGPPGQSGLDTLDE